MPSFEHLKPGDFVIRRMGTGGPPMLMVVREIQNDLLVCDTPNFRGGWTFDRKTGAEVDHDLQWGPQYGITGTYLTEELIVS